MTERHLLLQNDVRQIPQLADFVETIAQESNLDQALAMTLNLALEEAVTNVIMYAYPKGSQGLVDLAAPKADISLDVEERPIGGLGIYMVMNIMDSVAYRRENDRNILTMTKKI